MPSRPVATSSAVDDSGIGANATRMLSNEPKPPLEAKAKALKQARQFLNPAPDCQEARWKWLLFA